VYYSVSILPGWMQVVSRFSPATYVLDAVRKGLIQNVPATAVLGDAWPLVVMGAVLVPLGLWVFSRAERYAKRTGRLKRVR
jgi:ABC-2 type transport system permease protein